MESRRGNIIANVTMKFGKYNHVQIEIMRFIALFSPRIKEKNKKWAIFGSAHRGLLRNVKIM